jgi:hypothetical protein
MRLPVIERAEVKQYDIAGIEITYRYKPVKKSISGRKRKESTSA